MIEIWEFQYQLRMVEFFPHQLVEFNNPIISPIFFLIYLKKKVLTKMDI
jgi:hypothetical protein